MLKPKRNRKCPICKEWYSPFNTFQRTCTNTECMIEFGKQKKVKDKRKAVKEFKENDKSHLMKIAQQVVNKYVRLRDQEQPCITCNTIDAKWDAGHFLSAGGHGSLRFNTNNIFKQCFRCNRMRSGEVKIFKDKLIDRYGIEFVNDLERRGASTRKYDVDYLKRLIDIFKRKIKLYESRFR